MTSTFNFRKDVSLPILRNHPAYDKNQYTHDVWCAAVQEINSSGYTVASMVSCKKIISAYRHFNCETLSAGDNAPDTRPTYEDEHCGIINPSDDICIVYVNKPDFKLVIDPLSFAQDALDLVNRHIRQGYVSYSLEYLGTRYVVELTKSKHPDRRGVAASEYLIYDFEQETIARAAFGEIHLNDGFHGSLTFRDTIYDRLYTPPVAVQSFFHRALVDASHDIARLYNHHKKTAV